MAGKTRYLSILTLLSVVPLLSASPAQSQGISAAQPSVAAVPSQAASLAHLYWHFLMYQDHLDTKASERDSQGKEGKLMRKHLQGKLGFSDAEFAPIRTSSARLASKVKSLDAQAVQIRSGGPSSTSHGQLKALTAQRQAYIDAEVSYLKQTLAPDKIGVLEAFLARYFSPANAVPHVAPTQPVPTAVHP